MVLHNQKQSIVEEVISLLECQEVQLMKENREYLIYKKKVPQNHLDLRIEAKVQYQNEDSEHIDEDKR